MMVDRIIVTGGSMETAERHLEMVVQVILEEHALHVGFKLLRVGFRKSHFCQDLGFARDLRCEKKIYIADGEITGRTRPETKRRSLRRTGIIGSIGEFPKALDFDSMQDVERLTFAGGRLRWFTWWLRWFARFKSGRSFFRLAKLGFQVYDP